MTDYFGIIVAGIIAVGGLYLLYNKKPEDSDLKNIVESIRARDEDVIALKEEDNKLEEVGK